MTDRHTNGHSWIHRSLQQSRESKYIKVNNKLSKYENNNTNKHDDPNSRKNDNIKNKINNDNTQNNSNDVIEEIGMEKSLTWIIK